MPDGITNAPKYEQTAEGIIDFTNIDSMPGQHVDAFSRLRVSNPGYRFDSQLTYQIDSDLWDSKVTGDGSIAHDATNRKATLTSGTTAGANTAILIEGGATTDAFGSLNWKEIR